MKKVSKKGQAFNNFRFEGLKEEQISNKYLTMNRISENQNKIVVNVADAHLLPTQFGYALILDQKHVVFVKDWQVSRNYFGNEVLLDKNFFNVKEWGNFEEFAESDEPLTWEHWFDCAKVQQDYGNSVRWEI